MDTLKIPLPCEFGEKYNGKTLEFVSWFHWTKEWEYTYVFDIGDVISNDGKEYYKGNDTAYIEIDRDLLVDKPMKDHGYPLKGTGFINGIEYQSSKLFADIILTSRYLTHIRIECDKHGNFIENGAVLYPPTPMYETQEKRDSIWLKSCFFFIVLFNKYSKIYTESIDLIILLVYNINIKKGAV